MSYLDYPILKEKISLLPTSPGSYQMKDENGTIIYVGKAKSLVKRVKQYFTRPQVGKVARMVSEIRDFDIITTSSEKEALLLEISLIHKYYPKYNILLMDDKQYPLIALKKEKDPILKIARNSNEKGYSYFGPFPNSSQAYKMIDLLNRIYPLRKCMHIPSKPCLYYHLNQCLGPCINKIDPFEYESIVSDITKFLNGDTSKTITSLKQKMKEASDNLNFEKAGEIKKTIDMINNITSSQNIVFNDHVDRDVIAFSTRDNYICVFFLLYRKGVLLGKKSFVVEQLDDTISLIEEIVLQFYSHHTKPKELIVPKELEDSLLSSTLDIKIIAPIKGSKKELVLLGIKNSKQVLDEHFLTARLDDDVLELLNELKEKLDLKKAPLDIELYDNSHTAGYECISAMVKYINGVKVPKMYRKYNIRQENKQDDLASMEEVLTRRFTRLIKENQKMPDLIILDGGMNQCNIGLKVKKKLNVDIPLAGLEKNDKHETDSLINADTGEIIPLDRKSPLFFLLMRMQDEVHRYAISFHREKRSKALFKNIYDEISGLGIKRKEKLLELYPTIDSLVNVSEYELSQIVSIDIAKEILNKRDKYYEQLDKINKENEISK